MNFISTPIHGLYILENMPYDDARGSFYIPRYTLNDNNAEWLKENGLECNFKERKR